MILGLVTGYSAMHYFQQPKPENRYLASVPMSKLGSEQYAKTLFDVKIKNENLSLNKDEPSSLIVTVTAFKAIPEGLQYRWNLPESASLVEGSLFESLGDFAANQSKEIRIKVKGYAHDIKNYISFSIEGNLEGKKIQRSVLISSRPEDSFEYVVQEYEKTKSAESATKNKLKPQKYDSRIDLNRVSF